MTLRESVLMIVTHVAMAAGATLVLLIGFEWLMPGSVLPLVDVIDYLAPISVILLIIASFGSSKKGFFHWVQIFIGILTALLLIGILASRLNVITIRTAIPLLALAVVAFVWTLTARE